LQDRMMQQSVRVAVSPQLGWWAGAARAFCQAVVGQPMRPWPTIALHWTDGSWGGRGSLGCDIAAGVQTTARLRACAGEGHSSLWPVLWCSLLPAATKHQQCSPKTTGCSKQLGMVGGPQPCAARQTSAPHLLCGSGQGAPCRHPQLQPPLWVVGRWSTPVLGCSVVHAVQVLRAALQQPSCCRWCRQSGAVLRSQRHQCV
jgi:hypothetical protein